MEGLGNFKITVANGAGMPLHYFVSNVTINRNYGGRDDHSYTESDNWINEDYYIWKINESISL